MFCRSKLFKPKCCIEQKRMELKKSFYSIKKPITLNEVLLNQ